MSLDVLLTKQKVNTDGSFHTGTANAMALLYTRSEPTMIR